MSRIPLLRREDLSGPAAAIHDEITAGRGRVAAPLNLWLNSPGLAQRAQALGAFCRYEAALAPRLAELAILVAAVFWRAGYAWHVHVPLALEAGLDAGVIEAVRTGVRPEFKESDEAAVHDFTHALLADRRVGDAAYGAAEAVLGRVGLVELVGTIGYYGLIALTINAFGLGLPEGSVDPFAAS